MMNLDDGIEVNAYAPQAKDQLDLLHRRLSETDASFSSRMDGKSTSGLAGSLAASFIWAGVFIAAAVFALNYVNRPYVLTALVIVLGLLLVMIVDNIMDFSYYGKISSYRNDTSRLSRRVEVGMQSVEANTADFLKARRRGWVYPLKAANSIPAEAAAIESTMASMETMKKGFLSGAKVAFYYAAAVAVALVGSYALFPLGSRILSGLSGEHIYGGAIQIILGVDLVAAAAGAIFAARFLWGWTDCSVTNITLFALLAGPVVFLVLAAVVAVVYFLIYWAVKIVLAVLGVMIVAAIAAGASSGG